MKKSIAEDIKRLTDFADRSLGKRLEITERLTRMPGNLNRHASTVTRFRMRLRYFSVAFSGAAITFDGEQVETFQVSCDALVSVIFNDDEVTLVESYGREAERHTTVMALDDTQDSS